MASCIAVICLLQPAETDTASLVMSFHIVLVPILVNAYYSADTMHCFHTLR